MGKHWVSVWYGKKKNCLKTELYYYRERASQPWWCYQLVVGISPKPSKAAAGLSDDVTDLKISPRYLRWKINRSREGKWISIHHGKLPETQSTIWLMASARKPEWSQQQAVAQMLDKGSFPAFQPQLLHRIRAGIGNSCCSYVTNVVKGWNRVDRAWLDFGEEKFWLLSRLQFQE